MSDNKKKMSKERKMTWVLSTLVCLIPVIVGILLYSKLPDQVVTHWGSDGEPNGWSSKFTGIILFPLILTILNMLAPAFMKADPKYDRMDDKVLMLIQWIFPVVNIFAGGSTLAGALNYDTNVQFTGPMLMGVLFIMIGNYMPKMAQTYTVGIKLPWTLADEGNWEKTHRLGGFVFVIGGFLCILAGLLKLPYPVFPVIFVLMVAIPTAYSYLYFRGVFR